MEKTNVLKAIEESTAALCDAVAGREGVLSDREYYAFVDYIREMRQVQDWCETIRKAENLKRMLKE